jgi:hypothetical protein
MVHVYSEILNSACTLSHFEHVSSWVLLVTAVATVILEDIVSEVCYSVPICCSQWTIVYYGISMIRIRHTLVPVMRLVHLLSSGTLLSGNNELLLWFDIVQCCSGVKSHIHL